MQTHPDSQELWKSTERNNPASQPQPHPVEGKTIVLNEAVEALLARADIGVSQYGTLLKTHNGRDALEDWYQEQCDAFMYATQFIIEWRAKNIASMKKLL